MKLTCKLCDKEISVAEKTAYQDRCEDCYAKPLEGVRSGSRRASSQIDTKTPKN
jgi:hypothetical protein